MKQKGKAVQPKVKGKKGLIVCRTCESTGLFGGNECPTCRGKGYLGTQARVRNADSGMIEQYRMLIRRPGFEGTSQEWALCETKNTARVVWLLPRPRKSGMMGQAGTHVPTGEKAGCDGQGKPSPYREQAGTHVPTSTDRVTAIVLVIRGAAADVREQIDQILHRKEK